MAALKFKYGKILSGVGAAVSSLATGCPPDNGGSWAQVWPKAKTVTNRRAVFKRNDNRFEYVYWYLIRPKFLIDWPILTLDG